MNGLRARLRVVRLFVVVALHLALGVALVALVFPFCGWPRREGIVRRWSHALLRLCGIRVRVVGPEGVSVYDPRGGRSRDAAVIDDSLKPGGRGAMLVLNHVSWIDIYVVHSLRAARFVAKSEIARWPVIGYLTDRTGTVFIERGRRHAVREANQKVAELLGSGHLVGVFPEGTTGDGDRLLPFHANLLQPAIDAGAPVVIGGLRYLDARGRPSAAASYAGDTTLVQSLVRIAVGGPLLVELHLVDAIDPDGWSRHEIARHARDRIARRLGFDDASGEAAAEIADVMVAFDPAAFSDAVGSRGRGLARALDPRDELL